MSHQLRKDKTCQNCSRFVEERFCTHCGQENVETRTSFFLLLKHFVEDFVHYDGKFWSTIKHLLFSPAKLTKEYLSGKRKSYMPPVQLYIFISFITFFIPAILPELNHSEQKEGVKAEVNAALKKESSENNKMDLFEIDDGISFFGLKNVRTVSQLDSIQQSLPKEKQLSFIEYSFAKKVLKKAIEYSNMDQDVFVEKVVGSFVHNLPKVLFVYMPFFAMFLWFFHSKKKWFYFDHGIYTLHFFAFMLLLILLVIVLCWFANFIFGENTAVTSFQVFLSLTCFFYSIFYFFRSHSKMYGERKAISRTKCFFLFHINNFFILAFLILYIAFTLLNMH